eukprot:2847200-Pleurochrysis_carterae.AAC.1
MLACCHVGVLSCWRAVMLMCSHIGVRLSARACARACEAWRVNRCVSQGLGACAHLRGPVRRQGKERYGAFFENGTGKADRTGRRATDV